MKKIIVIAALCFLGYIMYAQSWKTYPYHQNGSVLNFPQDEGRHSAEPTEWWYTCAHVTGDSTGTHYSFMLTYFYYPAFGFQGFRIFNLANDDAGVFYPETKPCNYPTMATDHLNIVANPFLGTQENWKTKTDSASNLIPFEYTLSAVSASGSVNMDLVALKPPLMVGGDGFLYEGASDYTYYYSQTLVDAHGTITLGGVTETVTGTAWIDRQYGTFNPYGGEAYEWFGIQLSNGMDLNVWNIFTTQNLIPDTCTYRISTAWIDDSTANVSSDFKLQRTKFAFTSDSARCYSQQWRYTDTGIDLLMTALHPDCEVSLPFRFYEGSMEITGVVNGDTVTGKGFAELLHSYANPAIQVMAPNSYCGWDGTAPVYWHLQNQDDGRPVYYDISVSTDGQISFLPVASHIADTLYNWDVSSYTQGTVCWLKVNAYSYDTTLTGNDLSDTSFVIGPLGIRQLSEENNFQVGAYPNPFCDRVLIQCNAPTGEGFSVRIFDIAGREIRTLSASSDVIEWNGTDEKGNTVKPGSFLLRISSGNKTGNILINKTE